MTALGNQEVGYYSVPDYSGLTVATDEFILSWDDNGRETKTPLSTPQQRADRYYRSTHKREKLAEILRRSRQRFGEFSYYDLDPKEFEKDIAEMSLFHGELTPAQTRLVEKMRADIMAGNQRFQVANARETLEKSLSDYENDFYWERGDSFEKAHYLYGGKGSHRYNLFMSGGIRAVYEYDRRQAESVIAAYEGRVEIPPAV